MTTRRHRIAVVSAGGFARARHIPTYKASECADLVACCDMNERLVKETCREFGIPVAYTSLEDMLERERPEIVAIVTAPPSHVPLARMCVDAGSHVLVEKPFTEDYDEFLEFQEYCASKPVKVMVSQNYRFQNPAIGMRRVIDGGEIGGVYWCELSLANSAGPRPVDNRKYRGPFVNIGVHVLDLARFYVGRPVVRVFAPRMRVPHAAGIAYPFDEIQLWFDNGAHAVARMDWTVRGHEEWITTRVQGTKGSALCVYPQSPDVIVQRPDGAESVTHVDEKDDSLRRVIAHFVDCIENDTEPSTGLADNRGTVEALLAAYVSCRTGRAVELPAERELLSSLESVRVTA